MHRQICVNAYLQTFTHHKKRFLLISYISKNEKNNKHNPILNCMLRVHIHISFIRVNPYDLFTKMIQ